MFFDTSQSSEEGWLSPLTEADWCELAARLYTRNIEGVDVMAAMAKPEWITA